MVIMKDLKLSKYKEKACVRCRQIADDLDSIEKTGDVKKSMTVDQKSPKIPISNSTNTITSVKDSPKITGMI